MEGPQRIWFGRLFDGAIRSLRRWLSEFRRRGFHALVLSCIYLDTYFVLVKFEFVFTSLFLFFFPENKGKKREICLTGRAPIDSVCNADSYLRPACPPCT